jgi:2,3-dihydroxyphenylpropionate 1,2-dioxygenase
MASGGMSHFPGTDRSASPEFEYDRRLLEALKVGRGRELAAITGEELDKMGTVLHLTPRLQAREGHVRPQFNLLRPRQARTPFTSGVHICPTPAALPEAPAVRNSE